MNRGDTIQLRTILAQFVNDQRLRYDDMPDTTKADKRVRAQKGKEIDAAVNLYHKLKPAPYKAPKQSKEITVGACPCGEPVKIGERYAVSTEGTTTITRRCDCGRTNDIDLRITRRVQPVDWHVRDCFCGEPVRLRSDYAGVGFLEYQGPWDFKKETRRNRTAKVNCRCGCKWSIQIRFTEITSGDNKGKTERLMPNTVVVRCAQCAKIDVPGMVPVEPKKKRGA